MAEDREADDLIVVEFRRRRRRQLVASVLAVLFVIPLFLLDKAGPQGLLGIRTTVVGIACFAVIVVLLVYSFVNWRCPACHAYLGRGFSPRFCQKCGARLQ